MPENYYGNDKLICVLDMKNCCFKDESCQQFIIPGKFKVVDEAEYVGGIVCKGCAEYM